MKQIRIYYECLEQGLDYIRPIIAQVLGQRAEVILVRRPKKASDLNDGSIAALLTMTTPDALITGIVDNTEIPLVLVEFTEAVTTEDHELQRTYGAIAAQLSGAYYLKLSGEKACEKEFGGADYNPYTTPRIFIDRTGYEGYIIAKWDTSENNRYTLQRNADFPSCPPQISLFEDTIQQAVLAFDQYDFEWYEHSLASLKQKESYKSYREKVDTAGGVEELLEIWTGRNNRIRNLNKLRFFLRSEWIGAKINRFSHAMDPDRGILTFISFLFSSTKKVFGIYALVRPRGDALLKQDMSSLDTMRLKLRSALSRDKSGLPDWLVEELIAISDKATSLQEELDFTPVWEKYKHRLTENKVVFTLAYFLDGMYLNHNGIKLTWDKRRLIGSTNTDFLQDFATYFHFARHTTPTRIEQITRDVDEDEVTYTLVHKVLIPNRFKITSVSYPGAQGGGAVLPNPELGKAQPREYPDIIAIPPPDTGIDVVLNESKGMYSAASVSRDLKKIMQYKTDPARNKALKETLFVAQAIDGDRDLKNIIAGISFGVKNTSSLRWKPEDVDFIFRIVNRERWAIGIFRQELKELIPVIEGSTDFPPLYACRKISGNP